MFDYQRKSFDQRASQQLQEIAQVWRERKQTELGVGTQINSAIDQATNHAHSHHERAEIVAVFVEKGPDEQVREFGGETADGLSLLNISRHHFSLTFLHNCAMQLMQFRQH